MARIYYSKCRHYHWCKTYILKALNIFCIKYCKPISATSVNKMITAGYFSSVAQSCLTLCNPMNCSTPGLPIHHQLPESTQTHVHCVGDAIQPSHPLLSPSTPALNLSQHQALFPMSQFFSLGGQSIGASASSSVLPMNIQDWFPLRWTGLISLQSRNSQESFPAPQLENINSSVLSLVYGPTFTSICDYWITYRYCCRILLIT